MPSISLHSVQAKAVATMSVNTTASVLASLFGRDCASVILGFSGSSHSIRKQRELFFCEVGFWEKAIPPRSSYNRVGEHALHAARGGNLRLALHLCCLYSKSSPDRTSRFSHHDWLPENTENFDHLVIIPTFRSAAPEVEALFGAAEGGHLDIMKVFLPLLPKGSVIDAVIGACRSGNYSALRLVQRYFRVDNLNNARDRKLVQSYAFVAACRKKCIRIISWMMDPYVPDCLFADGVLAACEEGIVSVVSHLLRQEIRFTKWNSALGYACRGGHVDVVGVLETYASQLDWDLALKISSKIGNVLLVEKAVINGAVGMDEAMILAAGAGHLAVVSFLVSRGAVAWSQSIQVACSAEHISVIDALVSYHRRQCELDELLCVFTEKEKFETVKCLVRHGARSLNEALQIALIRENLEICLFLLRKGARPLLSHVKYLYWAIRMQNMELYAYFQDCPDQDPQAILNLCCKFDFSDLARIVVQGTDIAQYNIDDAIFLAWKWKSKETLSILLETPLWDTELWLYRSCQYGFYEIARFSKERVQCFDGIRCVSLILQNRNFNLLRLFLGYIDAFIERPRAFLRMPKHIGTRDDETTLRLNFTLRLERRHIDALRLKRMRFLGRRRRTRHPNSIDISLKVICKEKPPK